MLRPLGIAVTIASAAAISIGALVSSATAETLRFTVWSGSPAHLGMLDGFAETFRETHPDVTVEFETIPFSDYVQKVTLQRAGGDTPDLGWVVEASAPAFIDAGVLVDLRPALENTDGFNLGDFAEGAMGLWQSGDSVYGVPFSTSPFVIYYNKSLFDAAGVPTPSELAESGDWTWAKLGEVAKSVAEKSDGVWGFEPNNGANAYAVNLMSQIMPLIRSHGGYAWRDGVCGFDSEGSIAAMTLYHGMMFNDRSVVPPGEQGDFFTGQAATTLNQMSRVSKLTDATFEWGIAPLPAGPEKTAFTVGQAALGVFTGGKNIELATEFLAHVANQENVATMSEFFPPARKEVLNSDEFISGHNVLTEQQMGYIKRSIEEGTILPSHQSFAQIHARILPVADQLWKPDADIPAVMKRICSTIASQL